MSSVHYYGGGYAPVADMSVLSPPSPHVLLSVGSFIVLDRSYTSLIYRVLDF